MSLSGPRSLQCRRARESNTRPDAARVPAPGRAWWGDGARSSRSARPLDPAGSRLRGKVKMPPFEFVRALAHSRGGGGDAASGAASGRMPRNPRCWRAGVGVLGGCPRGGLCADAAPACKSDVALFVLQLCCARRAGGGARGSGARAWVRPASQAWPSCGCGRRGWADPSPRPARRSTRCTRRASPSSLCGVRATPPSHVRAARAPARTRVLRLRAAAPLTRPGPQVPGAGASGSSAGACTRVWPPPPGACAEHGAPVLTRCVRARGAAVLAWQPPRSQTARQPYTARMFRGCRTRGCTW